MPKKVRLVAAIPLLIFSCLKYMSGGGDSYDLPNEWFLFTGYGWIKFGLAMVVAHYVLVVLAASVEKAGGRRRVR